MLILLGVVFIFIGASRGEVKTVLMKAIYICLECIGIG
nr:CD1871A family CXXC motif-containing protein [Scatolibacter rhodanostii]